VSSNKIEALLRGLGQGASLGLNDEASPAIAGKLSDWFGPSDPEGIPREYAAGSADADMRANLRRENAESQRAYPNTYLTGQIAGGLPSSVAMSGLGAGAPGLATRIASAGLGAGVRGGVEGAGLADDGNRLEGAARSAGPSAVLGMAGAGAPAAAKVIKDLFKGGPPSGPVLATAGAGAQPSMKEVARGAQINRAVPPKPPQTLPKNTAGPPRKASSPVNEKAAGPEETVTRDKAIPPPSSLTAEAAGAEAIPAARIPTELSSDMPAVSRAGKSLGDYFGEHSRALNKAMGRPPNWKAPSVEETVAQRGQSMTDALAAENSPEQLARLPKLDSEYAEAAANAGARRAAKEAARGKTTPMPMQKADTAVPSGNNASPIGGEFELNSASPSGEFKMQELMGEPRPAIHPAPTAVANFDAEIPIPPAGRTGMEQRLPELTDDAVENFTQQFGKRKPAWNYPQDYIQDYVRDELFKRRGQ